MLSFTVRRVSKRFGFREVPEEEDWNLYWTDYSVALERVMEMKRYQVCGLLGHLISDILKNTFKTLHCAFSSFDNL